MASGPQVEPRNFAQPRQRRRTRCSCAVACARRSTPRARVARTLRSQHKLTLVGLTEVDACCLGRDLPVPFVVHGHCGVETVVGTSRPRTARPRSITGAVESEADGNARLSRSEGRIVSDLLDRVAGCCALALGLETTTGEIGQDPTS